MQKIRLYKSPALRTVAILLAVMWAALIFSMSAEVASVSADRSGGITQKIVELLVSDFDKMSESERITTLSSADHIIRKIAHFCIYAVLGVFICTASLGFFAKPSVHLARSTAIGALYAASDELHQYFVPGRGPRFSDVLLDSVGVFCGVFIIMLIARHIRKETKNGT